MTNVRWPITLPQKPLAGTYVRKALDNISRFKVSYGSDMRRRKFTSVDIAVSFSMNLSPAQLIILEDFFHNSIADGASDFDFVEPVTSTLKSFSFSEPYSVADIPGPLGWRVSFSLIERFING